MYREFTRYTVNSAEDARISCKKIDNTRKSLHYRDLRYGKASRANSEAPSWKPATRPGCTAGECSVAGVVVRTELRSQPSTVRTHAGDTVEICEWACSRRLRPAATAATTPMISSDRSTAKLADEIGGRVSGQIASTMPWEKHPRFPEKYASRALPRCPNATWHVAYQHHT
jgi:hypothetical protein